MNTTTVVLCVHSAGIFLEKQLKTILSQVKSTPGYVIVSDDNPQSNDLMIVKNIFSQYNYELFNYKFGLQKGAKYNFLSSLKHCDSDFIFLADQDDIWHENKINTFLESLDKDYDSNIPLLMFSDATLIDGNGNKIHDSFFAYQGLTTNVMDDDSILYKNCVQGASCCMNRALLNIVIDSLNYIDIDNIYMHDWWIALLARYYGEYRFIDKALIDYRQHGNNQIGVFNKKLRFLYYVTRFSLYLENFKQAIRQVRELEKFTRSYQKVTHNLPYKELRHYGYISKIKKMIIKLLML